MVVVVALDVRINDDNQLHVDDERYEGRRGWSEELSVDDERYEGIRGWSEELISQGNMEAGKAKSGVKKEENVEDGDGVDVCLTYVSALT